jgi:hypothetical protein
VSKPSPVVSATLPPRHSEATPIETTVNRSILLGKTMMEEVMRIKIIALGLLLAAASAGAVGPAQADVSQTPVSTGCPAGYELMSVAAMEATGPYHLPREVDAGGNNNGLVCAKPQPDAVRDSLCKHGAATACLLQELGLPHYLFQDDDSPALQGAV